MSDTLEISLAAPEGSIYAAFSFSLFFSAKGDLSCEAIEEPW